ncbi:hypothetical protein BCR37DRAFT_376796 [Protomyces lactucae-debilis]|uniref:Uncharacterized protein n=1 Tax=Protomyces lactucae-debilis TaxID=2754530 RepID=A0A1Y2FQH8_PROLT|nr:uncharacterized protein BCR37DRAFT_376796 [Protomyces lactucae-debilis]ORY86238.1 hypothetical protein BCR37DRAFT_376796 [Protomyces lactucae-debilis]
MQAIPKHDVHRIQSAQVITSLAHAAKELLENAIDAHATKVSIKLVNHGLDLLEVADNGAGIQAADYASLATPHATSKLKEFGDLETLATLGFRGEALGALCSLSAFTVTTCTAETYPMGVLLTYSHTGHLESTKPVSAQIGTTVRIVDLFSQLPVRRKDLEKNAKREFAKAVKLLSAYAAIQEGIKMEIIHIPDTKGNKRVSCLGAQGTSGSGNPDKVMVEIFGSKLATSLLPINLTCPLHGFNKRSLSETGQTRAERQLICKGFVSKPWSEYGGMADRQLVSINKRPCSLPPLARLVSSLYQGAGGHKQPFFMFDLTLPPDAYDVNVSPDKRTIFLHNQAEILDMLREYLRVVFSDDRRVMPEAVITTPATTRTIQLPDSTTQASQPASDPPDILMASTTTYEASDAAEEEDMPASRSISVAAFSLNASVGSIPAITLKRKRQDVSIRPSVPLRSAMIQSALPFKVVRQQVPLSDESDVSAGEQEGNEPVLIDEASDAVEEETVPQASVAVEDLGASSASDEEAAVHVRPLQRFVNRLKLFDNSTDGLHVHNATTTCDSRVALEAQRLPISVVQQASMRQQVAQAGLDVNAEAAEASLSLSVSKNDFFGMHIVGQFNLGFIITERKGEIFIIDQHASDEKSNYERLRKETQMATQRLALPMELILSGSQRLVLADSLDILVDNGFGVVEEEQRLGNMTRQRYMLTSVPQSKNVSFDVSDLVEILDRIAEQSSSAKDEESQLVRCRKAERMFASRACRSSIMIGTALTRERMQSVVYHMGELQKPWNCPHGRPTMRHLANIQATMTGFRGDYT